MAERVLDIHLEFDPFALALERNPTRTIAEIARLEAEAQAELAGARLRHPEPVEVTSRTVVQPTTGLHVLVIGTRWIADGPEIT